MSNHSKSVLVFASFALLIVSVVALAVIVFRGIPRSQAPIKSRADNGPQNWSTPVQISHAPANTFVPSIYTDDSGTSHVVFGQTATQNDAAWQTYYTTNKSGTWSTPKLLDSTHDYRNSKIIADPTNSNHLYIVFGAYTSHYGTGCTSGEGGGCPNAYFMESTNGGASWSSPLLVQKDTYNPTIVLNPTGDLYLASGNLAHNGILISKRSAGATDWHSLASPPFPDNCSFPALAWTNNTLHVTSSANTAGAKNLYYSNYNGSTWAAAKILSDTKPSNNRISAMESNGDGKLIVLYSNDNEGPVMYVTSTNNGSSWTSPKTLGPPNSLAPSLSVSPDKMVYATWQQDVTNSTISFSSFDGSSWSSPKTIIGATAKNPAISSTSNSVNVVASVSTSEYNIYFTSLDTQQAPIPQHAVRINNDDPKITYSGPWNQVTDQGYTYAFAPAPLSSDTVTKNLGASASLSFTGTQVALGTLTWINRGFYDISLDGVKIDNWSAYSPGLKPKKWTSPILECAPHTIKVSQSDKSGENGGKLVVVDFFEYEKCTGPTPPPPSTNNGCQNNPAASAKCFSCKKDTPTDQVNIYDFSCFAKWYGATVGKT